MARWIGRFRDSLLRREHARVVARHEARVAALRAQVSASPPWLGVRFDPPGVSIGSSMPAPAVELRRGTYGVDFILKDGALLTQSLAWPLPMNATLELISSATGQRAVHQFRRVQYAMLTETFGRIEWFVYLER